MKSKAETQDTKEKATGDRHGHQAAQRQGQQKAGISKRHSTRVFSAATAVTSCEAHKPAARIPVPPHLVASQAWNVLEERLLIDCILLFLPWNLRWWHFPGLISSKFFPCEAKVTM